MKLFNTTKRGYRFNRILFYVYFIVILGFALTIMYQEKFNFSPKFYFNCLDETCLNPLMKEGFECKNELNILWIIPVYKDTDCMRNCQDKWCSTKYLSRGEYGQPPNKLILYFPMAAFILFFLMIIINHFLFNKGKTFDVEVPITKKIVINRDSFKGVNLEGFEDNSNDGKRKEGN